MDVHPSKLKSQYFLATLLAGEICIHIYDHDSQYLPIHLGKSIEANLSR